MSIESAADLAGMQHIGGVVATILREIVATAACGITTADLDRVGGAARKRHGVRSAPRDTYGFPGFTCISVNEEIVHGIPGTRRLRTGDVVKMTSPRSKAATLPTRHARSSSVPVQALRED